jgi:hypothetical protein
MKNNKVFELFSITEELNINVVMEERNDKNIPSENKETKEPEKKSLMIFVSDKSKTRNINVKEETKIKGKDIIADSTIQKNEKMSLHS